MAYTYHIDRPAHRVEVVFDDVLTADTVRAYLDEVWRDDRSICGFNELVDLRPLHDIRMNNGDMAAIAAYGDEVDDTSQASRLALVTDRRKIRMLAAVYRTLRMVIPGTQKRIEVFGDPESARIWLALP